MSALSTKVKPFVPLFCRGAYLFGYLDYPSSPVYRSFYVGNRWSSGLTSSLPAFSESKGLYILSSINLTYTISEGDFKFVSFSRVGGQSVVTSYSILDRMRLAWSFENQNLSVADRQKFTFSSDKSLAVYLSLSQATVSFSHFSSQSATRKSLLSAQQSRSRVSFLVEPHYREVRAFAVEFGRVYLPKGVSMNPKDLP